MPDRFNIMRSSTKSARPTGKTSADAGSMYVNYPDRQLGVIDTTGAALDLLSLRPFSATADYVQNDIVSNAGRIYRANGAITAGAFNAANWTEIGGSYTLSAATAATLGGVKATVNPGGQAVTGIDATGGLTFDSFAKLGADQQWTAQQYYKLTTLTYAANITWDCSLAQKALINLTGNATLAKPTNTKAGGSYWLWVRATGSSVLSLDGTGFDVGASGAPALSGGGKSDLLMFECNTDGGKLCFLGAAKGFA